MNKEKIERAKNVIRSVVQQQIAVIEDTDYCDEIIASEKLIFDSIPAENEKVIDMSNVCELAHELAWLECDGLGIVCDVVDDDGNTKYSDESQPIFDQYYDLINSVFNF